MSSFTKNIVIMAQPFSRTGWRRFLPPGLHRPHWELKDGFTYAVDSLDAPLRLIDVPKGFRFDGASVPFLLRMLVPMAHPNYIQAAALHDYMLENCGTDRHLCDRIFFEALGVLGMPIFWRLCLYYSVRIGGWRRWCDRLKGVIHAD